MERSTPLPTLFARCSKRELGRLNCEEERSARSRGSSAVCFGDNTAETGGQRRSGARERDQRSRCSLSSCDVSFFIFWMTSDLF